MTGSADGTGASEVAVASTEVTALEAGSDAEGADGEGAVAAAEVTGSSIVTGSLEVEASTALFTVESVVGAGSITEREAERDGSADGEGSRVTVRDGSPERDVSRVNEGRGMMSDVDGIGMTVTVDTGGAEAEDDGTGAAEVDGRTLTDMLDQEKVCAVVAEGAALEEAAGADEETGSELAPPADKQAKLILVVEAVYPPQPTAEERDHFIST